MFLLTGDKHAQFGFLNDIDENYNFIVLGDAGLLWNSPEKDAGLKKFVNSKVENLYVVRGNHERRPESCKIPVVYDYNVDGYVYCESEFPNIKYFMDGHTYIINGMRTLVIGGAYSVDKFYRLQNNWPWFEDEQLSKYEMDIIENNVKGQHYDVVLSHTCPFSWQPFDLFSPHVIQKDVDNTMEKWMDKIKDTFTFDYWFFGHFHDDRCVDKGVYMLYDSLKEFPSKGE